MQELKKLWALLWPDAQPTPLLDLPQLARLAGVGRVFVKVEGERPLGSFKALGGMIAGIRALAAASGVDACELLSSRTPGKLPRLICASEGNHGLAVAAGASKAGTQASVFLPREVSAQRAERIAAWGAEIIRIDGTYDDAVAAAEAAASGGEGLLISDTSNTPDSPVVNDVMAGYGLLADELIDQFEHARIQPTHLFVQAGVGGLAAAMVDGLQSLLRSPSKCLIVEPEAAPCVARAMQAGEPTLVEGDLRTSATMLACGMASAPALRILQRHRVASVLVSDVQLRVAAIELRSAGGPETTESGATGLAGLLQVAARRELRAAHRLDADSAVLLIATERA